MSALPLPFFGRSSSQEETKEWLRLETLRLRDDAGEHSTCTTREQQEVFIHRMRLHRGACWLCGFPMSQYDGARMIDIPTPHPVFTCLNCGIRLHHAVPFVYLGAPWTWTRPKDMTLQEVINTLEAYRDIWEKE